MTNKNELLIIDEKRRKMIPIADIIYIEASVNYSTIYLSNRKITVARHLKLISALLPDTFIRPHRKYIINQAFIKKIDLEGQIIQMKSNISLPIARRRLNIFQ